MPRMWMSQNRKNFYYTFQVLLINFFRNTIFQSWNFIINCMKWWNYKFNYALGRGLCVAWKRIHVKMSSTRPHMSMYNVAIHWGLIAWASCENGKKDSCHCYVTRVTSNVLYATLHADEHKENFVWINVYRVVTFSLKISWNFICEPLGSEPKRNRVIQCICNVYFHLCAIGSLSGLLYCQLCSNQHKVAHKAGRFILNKKYRKNDLQFNKSIQAT